MDQETDNTTSGEAFAPRPLGDILRSEPRAEPVEPAGRPEPQAAPEPEPTGEKPPAEPVAQPRQPDGKFAPKEAADAQKAGPPPAEQQQPPQSVPLSAVLEERKKRQALETQLRELQARLTAPAQPPAPAQPAQPEMPLEDLMFQDPQRFIQAVRAPLEEQLVTTRIAMSEQVARQQPDYVEAEAALMAYLESDPAAKAQAAQIVRQHPAPAMWALEQGRAILAQQRWGSVIQQYGSPEAYAEALRASQQPQPVAQPAAPASPPVPPASLASVRSAGSRSGPPPWRGPMPLSQILGQKR